MSRIIRYLKQPYPVSEKPWQTIVVAFIAVFLLLALFQPFQLQGEFNKWLIIGGYSLVTAACTSIVTYVFPAIFKKFYNPACWTTWRNTLNKLIIILTISIGNFLFDISIRHRDPEILLSVFTFYVVATFMVGLIPTIVISFFIQNNALKRNLREAKESNNRLLERLAANQQALPANSGIITLSGTTKDSVSFNPETLLYIESSGNYTTFYYQENDIVRQKQLRATISQIETDLQSYPDIVRCHRAFMVNIAQVVSVTGNSLGFQLKLRYTKDEVPVSRTYTRLIRTRIAG